MRITSKHRLAQPHEGPKFDSATGSVVPAGWYMGSFPGGSVALRLAAFAYWLGALDDQAYKDIVIPIEGDGDPHGDYAFYIVDKLNASVEGDSAWWGIYHGELYFFPTDKWAEIDRTSPSHTGKPETWQRPFLGDSRIGRIV